MKPHRKASKRCSNITHSKYFWFLGIILLTSIIVAIAVPLVIKKRNALDKTVHFYNPDRGLFTQWDIFANKYQPPTPWELEEMRRTGNSVVHFPVYLNTFLSTPISDKFLSDFAELLNRVRDAGLKVILRFAYTDSIAASPADAAKALVKQHITQLSTILRPASDIILLLEVGFIGVWGEWYYTQNFGNEGVVSDSQWADRVEIMNDVLGMVPGKMVLVRTAQYKQRLLGGDVNVVSGTASVNASTAFGNSTAARIGFHNDCFGGINNDMGTFRSELDRQYMISDSLYVPMEGESCDTSNPTLYSCPTSLSRLQQEHYSLLNDAHHPDVLKFWQQNGCYDSIVSKLGYRFTSTNPVWYGSTRTGRVGASGATVRVAGWERMEISNRGNVGPFNEYVVEVLFVPGVVMGGAGVPDGVKGNGFLGTLDWDLRRIPGSAEGVVIPETSFDVDVGLVDGSVETYGVFINIRSKEPTLAARPPFRIIFANDETVIPDVTQTPFWTQSRINSLAYNATVTPGAVVAENRNATKSVKLGRVSFELKGGLLSWT
ncbi:hypothetical protein HK097_009658 [Rhizophlyctis rosea]|uniref:DUF4874 domain-containing protein n=1 Tax=Rhizophlyctis rosea TaxID=64517 RepID=A0AAD5X910_9FUNG|nr:hypothetical protein HK097_009658 [Rhizophlyctis rosea]